MKNKKTNNPDLADFNFDLDALKNYEIEFRGAKIKAEGPEDHARAMEALSKMEQVLPAAPTERELFAEQERKIIEDFISKSTPTPSAKISEVQEQWIAERELKNKPRTVTSKKYHFKDFITRALKNEDVEINSLNKASIANYKKALLKEGQTGKTIDNKLLTLMCSGLINPGTNLGENTRYREVFDEQAKTIVFPRVQATGSMSGLG